MLQLARSVDRDAVNLLAGQIHALHTAWRPDIFRHSDVMYSQERFEAAIRDRELYVAKLSDRVVGYVLVSMRRYDCVGHVYRKVMVLNEICVDESCRGHGIGHQILEDVKALGRAYGCTDLQLSVYAQNSGAITFYEKCGLAIRCIEYQMKL